MFHRSDILPRNPNHGCYTGGVVNWRTRLVHYAAKVAGLCVKIEGMPLGTSRNLDTSTVSAAAGSFRKQIHATNVIGRNE